MRNFSIECHDWPKCVSFWNQSELAWSKVMVLALRGHFLLLGKFESFLEQIFNAHLHDDIPNIFAVVVNPRIFLLLLSAIKVAAEN